MPQRLSPQVSPYLPGCGCGSCSGPGSGSHSPTSLTLARTLTGASVLPPLHRSCSVRTTTTPPALSPQFTWQLLFLLAASVMDAALGNDTYDRSAVYRPDRLHMGNATIPHATILHATIPHATIPHDTFCLTPLIHRLGAASLWHMKGILHLLLHMEAFDCCKELLGQISNALVSPVDYTCCIRRGYCARMALAYCDLTCVGVAALSCASTRLPFSACDVMIAHASFKIVISQRLVASKYHGKDYAGSSSVEIR